MSATPEDAADLGFDDWILALHVLSAFAAVAAMVLFRTLVVAMRASTR